MSMDFYQRLGWGFLLIAAIFSLGLARPFARRFYPGSPGFIPRLAAPVIFALLAAACFAGVGMLVFVLTATLGLTQIVVSRSRRRGTRRAG